MSNSDLVSIVIPVYGVEKYLSACVDAVLAQTHTNLEIILIDDASPDNCGLICDDYAHKDDRIKVIHKENGGAASARNAGLDAASGNYICFIDSDDLVHPEYVASLLRELTGNDADIAVCGFVQLTKNCKTICEERESAGVYDMRSYLSLFLTNWTCALLWNKIFRREVIGDIRMEEGHRIDDEFFTYQVVLNSKRIVVFDTPLYQYRLRASSVMGDAALNSKRILMDRIEYTQRRCTQISEQVPELRDAFFQSAVDSFIRYWRNCSEHPQACLAIRRWAKANFRRIIQMNVPVRMKLGYLYNLYIKTPPRKKEKRIEEIRAQEYFD